MGTWGRWAFSQPLMAGWKREDSCAKLEDSGGAEKTRGLAERGLSEAHRRVSLLAQVGSGHTLTS